MKTQGWVILLPLLVVLAARGCSANPDAKRLVDDLIRKQGYDPLVRPVKRYNRNITIHFGAALAEIENLTEIGGKLTYRLLLRMWWNDYQLSWSPSEYGNIKKITVSPDLIWTPDIDLYNSVDKKIDRVRLTVFNNGDIIWMPPAHYTSTCQHEFRTDSWHCPLLFRSWSYDASELDVKPLEGLTTLDTSELYASAHWFLLEVDGKRDEKVYPCCEEPFPTMEYVMKIRNKIGHPALLGRRRRSAV